MCCLTNRLLNLALFIFLISPALVYGDLPNSIQGRDIYKPLKNSSLACEFLTAKPTNNDFVVWKLKKDGTHGKNLGPGSNALLHIKRRLASLKISNTNNTTRKQLKADRQAILLCSELAKNCIGQSCNEPSISEDVASTFILTFNVTGNGAGLTLPAIGQKIYPAGSVANLLAVPNTNSIFTGWSGALSGTQSPVALIMDSHKNVTANFSLLTPASGLPLVLTGTPPENKSMLLNLAGIPGSVGFIDLTLTVYDADRPDEGILYVNGQAVAPLFGANGQAGNDNRVVSLPPIRVPAYLFQVGNNTLSFYHSSSAGFRIEGLSIAYIAVQNPTRTPSRTPTGAITRTPTLTPTRTRTGTPTLTPTRTLTPLVTRTYTPSPTRTITPTYTRTLTPTPGAGTVTPVGCNNRLKDGNELGVDCGGSCSFECPSSQILGIDVTLNGTPGKDYAVEWMYHDARVDDSKVIYLKDSVQIGFLHTSRNRMQSHLEGEMTLIGANGADGVQDPSPTQCL